LGCEEGAAAAAACAACGALVGFGNLLAVKFLSSESKAGRLLLSVSPFLPAFRSSLRS
jgi:hypothetical protein